MKLRDMSMTITLSKQEIITEPDFQDLKVLIAEDNEVNQLLAKGILQYWNVYYKVAVTGFEVIQFLQQEHFDLILMDIQMPEKSGIEAALEIRNFIDPVKRNIPIIALTANGLKGEEKKYIAVGMNDFLTKPFKENDLKEVIKRVLRKEGQFNKINTTQPKMNTDTNTTEKLYDFDQLEEIAEGNDDFLVSLAQIYVDTIPATSEELLLATKAADWSKVAKLAHKLKSTIDSMNMHSITTDIRVIENDAKNKTNTFLLNKVAVRVDEIINAVASQLKQDYILE